MAAVIAAGPSPLPRPRAISEACWTSVFVSLSVRRFTARRRSDWRTRLSAEGVRAPFQVRAVLATWNPQLEIEWMHIEHTLHGARRVGEYSIACSDEPSGDSTTGRPTATIPRPTSAGLPACKWSYAKEYE